MLHLKGVGDVELCGLVPIWTEETRYCFSLTLFVNERFPIVEFDPERGRIEVGKRSLDLPFWLISQGIEQRRKSNEELEPWFVPTDTSSTVGCAASEWRLPPKVLDVVEYLALRAHPIEAYYELRTSNSDHRQEVRIVLRRTCVIYHCISWLQDVCQDFRLKKTPKATVIQPGDAYGRGLVPSLLIPSAKV